MLGVIVVRSDLTSEQFEATEYDVADDGSLTLYVDEVIAARVEPAEWIEVRRVGARLAPTWPPADLDQLLDALDVLLCGTYGYCSPPRLPGLAAEFTSGLLNEMDALTHAVLERLDIDSTASNNRAITSDLKAAIRRHFRRSSSVPGHVTR